ncbi:MAG TPA: hypothetical protein VEL47_01135, partial [Myxococcota bacterium]|nr:hypothetical protein [Myxococcota bacterium]
PIEKLLSRKVEAKKVFEWWKIPVVRERINVYGLKELLKHRLHIENRHIFLAVELPEGMQFAVATVPPEAKPTEFYALVESKPGITMGAIASALGKIEGMLYVDVHNIYVTEEGKIRVPFSSSSDQQTLSVHDTITVRDNIHLNIKIEKN